VTIESWRPGAARGDENWMEMFGMAESVDSVAHVIQIALTPVFLLSGIAALLNVFSTRLGRVSDHVDALAEKLEDAEPAERERFQERLLYLRRRSHILDFAVMLGTLGGAATCLAALFLFVGTLRVETGVGVLFVSFGLALLFTVGALAAFLIEVLLAGRGIRERVAKADEIADAEAEMPDESAEHGAADSASGSSPP
jgi:hypothetical protein